MVLEELIGIAEKERETRKQICVRCCMSAGCMSSRSAEVRTALEKAVNGKAFGGSRRSAPGRLHGTLRTGTSSKRGTG